MCLHIASARFTKYGKTLPNRILIPALCPQHLRSEFSRMSTSPHTTAQAKLLFQPFRAPFPFSSTLSLPVVGSASCPYTILPSLWPPFLCSV